MRLVYPDQNALVDLFDRQQKIRTALHLPENVQIVLSPVHWIEAARCSDPIEAAKIADFMDSLNPFWLRERIAIEQSEVEAVLTGRPADLMAISPIRRSRTEAVNEVGGQRTEFSLITSSWEIVKALRSGTAGGKTMEQAYELNETSFKRNVADFKRRRMPTSQGWTIYITGLCRSLGLACDAVTVAKITPENVRALTIEFEISQEYWRCASSSRDMRKRPQRQNDIAHICAALPYVDNIITRDNGVTNLVHQIRQKVPFTLAGIESTIDAIS